MKLFHRLLPLVLFASSCTTMSSGRRAQSLRRDNELEILKTRVAKLENRVNDIEAARQRLYEENDALRAGIRRENESLRADLEALRKLISAVETARAQDRKEIVEALSKRMHEVLARQQKTPVYQTGREHTVQQGETLSEIARAYGVAVKTIVDANKRLKTANTIIVPGQKLFIPE